MKKKILFIFRISLAFNPLRSMKIALSVAVTLLLLVSIQSISLAQSITTSTSISGSPFCPSSAVSVSYAITGTYNTGNVFTAQLSDAVGNFSSPVTLGTRSSTNASAAIAGTIPSSVAAGSGYRIRVVSSNPVVVGTDNAFNLTINAISISAPSFTGTTFCQAQAVSITFTKVCNFSNTGFNNVFTAQLSDATGSFASPTTIGSLTSTNAGTISATIPSGTPAGTQYRIRIVSSNPVATSPDNGTDLTVIAPVGTPTVFGNGAWNVYAYAGTSFTNYSGYYTENGTSSPFLSFNTTNRWATGTSPSSADASSGLAYQGCPITNGSTYSFKYMRTNFPCGYYQIDIPTHDDNVTLLINGTQVFQHIGYGDSHTNVWTGFLGASSTIEVQLQNNGGSNSFLSMNIAAATNPLTMSTPATVCSGSSTTLTVSSPLTLSYAWTPTATVSPTTGASVTATPTATTTYTVTGTDATTSCTVSNSVVVTVSSTPTTAMTATATTICSSVTTSTLTASGANTYAWTSSADGYTATLSTSNTITVNPTVSTTYKVTGAIGACHAPSSVSQLITVQNLPPNPPDPTTTYGNGAWNVYCHNNTTFSNYYGYYTENNLSFNTTSRWGNNSGPSVANNTSGSAYAGCSIPSTQYSASFKRTGIPCGYYQIDIPYHDDNITLFVNGTQVFQHNGCCDAHTNTWSGFLSPSSTVEFQLVNFNGPGSLQVAFSLSSPLTLSPPATICANTNTTVTSSSSVAGVTYAWSVSPAEPTFTFTSPTSATTFAQTTAATPGGNYTVTSTVTDAAGTGCTASSSVVITVNPLPSTAVTPSTISTYCPSAGITLTASGANTYTWSPTTGLSASTGYQVIATPSVTTTYTVTGSNNCSTNQATSTITVLPLPAITTSPTGTWNVYGFNSQTIGTNYQGYYTENGSGTSGYDFNTTTRWASGGAPSTANATNGTAWQGCAMSATNISLSFKRSNFACGVYQIDVLGHDDYFTLFINGVQVANHNGCCDTHTNVWTGTLNSSSTVEWQLVQGTGGSYLQVQFMPITQSASQSTWTGGTSTDWFTASNWCGSGVPTSSIDVLIPAAGPQNMPAIANTGAVCRNLTINSGVSAGTYNSAIPAATLTSTSNFNLSVYGNWVNNGSFSAASGTVAFMGTGSGNTISSSATQSFNNLTLNKTNGLTISSGIVQVAGVLTLTNGILFQNGAFEILNGATVSGASNTSYVDGTVKKVGNSAFTFPVGKGGIYRPIAMSAPSVATDHFTAQYFNSNANGSFPLSQHDATLDHLSGAEYWILNRTGGSSNVNVTLSWDTNSGGVTASKLTDLRVSRWDASTSKWKDHGNGGTAANPNGNIGPNATAGTVTTSAAVTSFSPFTLASVSSSNPLPVELVSFEGRLTPEGEVKLTWVTASELHSAYFMVTRSKDGIHYEDIGKVTAAGTSNQQHTYALTDYAPLSGYSYYRLKQYDLDGTFVYSELIAIYNPATERGVVVYPNPANDKTNVTVSGADLQSLTVWNSIGEQVSVPITPSTDLVTVTTSSLVPGIYILRVWASNKMTELKVVVER